MTDDELRLSDLGPLLVVALAARLRAGGAGVSTGEVLDAMSALTRIDLTSRSRVRVALRATLVKNASHDVLFRRSFEAIFPRYHPGPDERPAGPTPGGPPADAEEGLLDTVVRALREDDPAGIDQALDEAIARFSGNHDDGRSAGHHAQRVLRRMNVPDLYRRYLDPGANRTEFDRGVGAAEARAAMEQMSRRLTDMLSGRVREGDGVVAQQLEDLQDRPLLRAGADELAAMRMAMRPLARHLAARLGALRRRGGSGVDMRRTIRSSMGYGGVPVAPVLRLRRPAKPDLVVLCDVSGSTAQFAPFTLTLLHALHEEFRRVRSFVFIDGIVEITELMESSPGVIVPVTCWPNAAWSPATAVATTPGP